MLFMMDGEVEDVVSGKEEVEESKDADEGEDDEGHRRHGYRFSKEVQGLRESLGDI